MQVSRNKSKYKGLKQFIYSAKYSLDGLFYSYKNERSLRIHAAASMLAIVLGFFFKISHIQWALVLVSLAIILAFELVNTAMEAAIDLVTLEYHELARIAKDCCSAATFVMSIAGLITMSIIFGPHILNFLNII
ncbi:MAG TPA: diacylglycerol kinase [Firmicutes bacterium]|nr:diacylglycerol kinase [Bacillota bacterium]